MNAVGRLGSYISRGVVSVAAPFHPFGGAVDIVVVEQEDGSFRSSPWYVQFGKFQGVLKAREKVVTINVNGVDANFRMYLDGRGGAYFVREADGESALWGDEANGISSMRRPMKIMSCNYDGQRAQLVSELEASRVVTRSSSTGPRMVGVVGRNSENESAPQHQQNAVGGVKEGSMGRAEVAADLLEVRWSTSLATRKQRKGNASCNSDSASSGPRSVCTNGECDAVIPPTAAPKNYMESFTLEETYIGANAVPDSSVGSNGGDIRVVQTGEGVDKCDVSEVSSSSSFVGGSADVTSDTGGMSNGDEQSSTSQALQPDDGRMDGVQPTVYCSVSRTIDVPAQALCNSGEVTSELLSNTLACEMDKNKENLDKNDPCKPTDGSSTDVGTSDDDDTVLETQVEVILDSKTDGPVKYVEKMVVDQVPPELDPSLTNSLLVEDILENHANLVPSGAESNGDAFTSLDSIPEESNSINCGGSIDDRVDGGSPENLNEVQFFFSDLDGSEPLKSVHNEPPSLNSLEVEETLDDFSVQHSQKALSNDHSSASEIPRTISSPVKIARVHEQVNQIAETVEPLSSTWSHGAEMNTQSVNHPISCSLDSSINTLRLVQVDVATTSEVCTPRKQLTPRQHSVQNPHTSDELRKILSDPAVEVSLCRHLLHEGMGHEAAARAFDAEKLETEMFVSLAPDIIKDDRVVVRVGGLYFPWDAALPIISAIGAPRNERILEPKGIINVEQAQKGLKKTPEQSIDSTNGSWRLWPFRRTKSVNRRQQAIVVSATDNQREPTRNADSPRQRMKANDSQREATRNTDSPRLTMKANDSQREPTRKPDVPRPEDLKRTLVRAKTPTSEQLASLNLKDGRNEVIFTFSTPVLGEQKVDCRIYLWKWNSRIVISDVDGTITKSDVLGQFMPMVGIDWSQTGVTHLFSGIKENGYELLFLSARAISQASLTRQFLFNLKQDGKALPDGPVVISPDGLFPSLFREVIRRAPHEFKIACLEDIKALFPADHKPFYAGFGNRDTDEISYLKVGIPLGKIFIINPRGEVAVHRRVDTKSYTSLHALVHDMFPPPESRSASEQEDFNSWNFWRLPPPEIVG